MSPTRTGWAFWKSSALSRHASSAVMGYAEEALAERSAEWCRDPSLREKFNESDPLQDKGLTEVLEKMDKALANIREENKRQDIRFEKLKGEFEHFLLESEEFKSTCRQQLADCHARSTSVSAQSVELRAISTDGHAKNGGIRGYPELKFRRALAA